MSLKNAFANVGLVYSTEAGRMCPGCRQPVAACTCNAKPIPKGDGVVRVGLREVRWGVASLESLNFVRPLERKLP